MILFLMLIAVSPCLFLLEAWLKWPKLALYPESSRPVASPGSVGAENPGDEHERQTTAHPPWPSANGAKTNERVPGGRRGQPAMLPRLKRLGGTPNSLW